MNIDEHFNHCRSSGGDISEHMVTLREYAKTDQTILELGVRSIVSTWAFLAARPKRLVSVDIVRPSKHGGNLTEVYDWAEQEHIDFVFIEANDLELDLDEKFNLLFIDTLHTYSQIKAELARFSPLAMRHIIIHDTVTFGEKGEIAGQVGILPAIKEFLDSHPEWTIVEDRKNCNGLMVLERK